MTRWLAELQGDDFDLSEFPRWFPRGEVHAVHEQGGYYLTGSAFAADSEPNVVHQLASAALQELFAVICLLRTGIRMPTIGNVFFEAADGTRKGYAVLSATCVGRSKLTANLTAAGAEDAGAQPTQAELLLAASRSNRHLQIGLLLLSNPSVTWPHLYRSLEEIETFLGKQVHQAGLCSRNERDRFTRSANTAEISGNDSRHGLHKFTPPDKPMDLAEARGFVIGVLRASLVLAGPGRQGAV